MLRFDRFLKRFKRRQRPIGSLMTTGRAWLGSWKSEGPERRRWYSSCTLVEAGAWQGLLSDKAHIYNIIDNVLVLNEAPKRGARLR